jgi:hypothetical protein
MSKSHSTQANCDKTHSTLSVIGGKKYVKLSSSLNTPSDTEIRERAYQIYESNGHQDLFAEQDWLRAEKELRGRGRP